MRPVWLSVPLAIYFFVIFITSDVPHAHLIGGDDGLEVSKSLLAERKPGIVANMWNDQPWLHTIIIARLFDLFGEVIWMPRLLSSVSAFLLISFLNCFYSRQLSLMGLAAMDFFLLTADEFCYMVFSGMTEIPAITWATIAAVACSLGSATGKRFVLIGSGILYAASMHIKLTALILFPCILWGLVAGGRERLLGNAILFGLSWMVANVLLIAISPAFNLNQIWMTHTDSRNILSLMGSGDSFRAIDLFQNPALIVAGAFGIWSRLKEGKRKTLCFPVLFLISASLFALLQRPWWKFYLVHFCIPLAILAAFGLDNLLVPRAESKGEYGTSRLGGVRNALLLLVICTWCGFAFPAYRTSVKSRLYSSGLFEDLDVIRAARKYRDAAHVEYCYTLKGELAFTSGLLLPPDLTVVSIKRGLVTGFNSAEILSRVKELHLGLLMLQKTGELSDSKWLSWVTNEYEYVAQGATSELWVRKDMRSIAAEEPASTIGDLRLKYIIGE